MAGLFTPQYNFFGQEMTGTYDPSLTKDAQAYAALPAGRGAVASAYQASQEAANSFGNAIGGLFNMAGVQSPIQQKQRALQGIIGSINPQDPTSLQQAASQLLGMGMTTEAQQLMEEARKIAESKSLVGQREASAVKDLSWEGVERDKFAMQNMTELQKQQMKLRLDEMLGKEKLKLDSATTSAQVAESNARIAKIQDERAKLQAETGFVGYTTDMKEAKRLSDLDVKVSSGTATEQERYELSRLAANAGAVKQLDPTKLVPKTLEITAPYAKNQIATSGIVKVGNEVMQLMNLDDKQQARFIAQPEEFMKEWLSNQDNKTRLKNAKSRFSNAQVVQLLSQLSGSTSNEELKRFAEGLNNGYTNDAVFMKDMLMAMQGAKDELTFINDAVTYAEQNGNDPLKVQKYISDKTLERLSKTTQQANSMVGGAQLTPKQRELLNKYGK